MHPKFRHFVDKLHPKFEALINSDPFTLKALHKDLPSAGIYLFSEDGHNLYVGRSNNIRRRIKLHCRPSSQHNQATFAFKVTREITGNLKATYKSGIGSRAALVKEPEFLQCFTDQKSRISDMDIRVVEEADPNRQALLEMYASIVLETPYNDFDNH